MILRSRFATSLCAATAAGLLVAAFVPATAATLPGATAQTQATVGKDTAGVDADRKAEPRRYCLRYITTGSRIVRERCQTKAEWWSEGVDIDQLDR